MEAELDHKPSNLATELSHLRKDLCFELLNHWVQLLRPESASTVCAYNNFSADKRLLENSLHFQLHGGSRCQEGILPNIGQGSMTNEEDFLRILEILQRILGFCGHMVQKDSATPGGTDRAWKTTTCTNWLTDICQHPDLTVTEKHRPPWIGH